MKINKVSSKALTMMKCIPNLITIINLAWGFWSIRLIFQGLLYEAVLLVIAGMVLDYLDGKTARMLNASTELGKHLDSLSDLVTFGVAPALMCWMALPLNAVGGGFLAIIYLWCGAYRLADFNTRDNQNSICFQGFPITPAGSLVAVLCLYHYYIPIYLLIFFVLLLSLSMISDIPYYSFKPYKFTTLQAILLGLLAVVTVLSFLYPWLWGMVWGSYYLSGILLFFTELISKPHNNARKIVEWLQMGK